MKSWMLSVLCLALSLAIAQSSQGQSTSPSGSQASQSNQNQGSQSQTSTNGGQNMSGTVSHDRKSVTNDKNDKRYTVDNPDALKGKEDQHVALLVAVDPDTNVIHVIQIEAPQQ
jgi:hypothetical protein